MQETRLERNSLAPFVNIQSLQAIPVLTDAKTTTPSDTTMSTHPKINKINMLQIKLQSYTY